MAFSQPMPRGRGQTLGGALIAPGALNVPPPTLGNPMAAALVGTGSPAQPRPMIGQSRPNNDLLARALLAQGNSGEPIRSPLELMGRLAQVASGTYGEQRAVQAAEEKQAAAEAAKEKKAADAIAAKEAQAAADLERRAEYAATALFGPPGPNADPKREQFKQGIVAGVVPTTSYDNALATKLGLDPAADVKPPTVQEFYDQTTGQKYKAQYNSKTATWDRVGGVEKPASSTTTPYTDPAKAKRDLDNGLINQEQYDTIIKGGGKPFDGLALDAQDSNIILTGDPASPEYELAFNRQFMTPRLVQGQTVDGQMIITPVMPSVPPGVRRPIPAGGASAASVAPAAAGATPGAPTAGGSIVVGDVKPSDAQRTAALFTNRALAANEIIDKFEQEGIDWTEMSKNNVPLWGNGLISGPYRQLLQAERDFVNAILRPESGAVISPSEFENARQQYFPQPGDDPATVAQKNKSRQTEIDGLKLKAGLAYKEAPAPVAAPVERYERGPDGVLRKVQ